MNVRPAWLGLLALAPILVVRGAEPRMDISYVQGASRAQRLDFFPAQGVAGPAPLVVWIHGGAWQGGDKRQNPAVFLTGHGYAVASLNYRLSQESIFPAQIHDSKAAIRFLRTHAEEYGIDPQRIGVWGSSAGGHLASLLGTSGGVAALEGSLGVTQTSSRVQAVVNYFGPANLLRMGAQSSPGARIDHDAADSPESRLIGGAVQENRDAARAASPQTHVSADDPPILHVHGDQDPLVPVAQSQEFHDALRAAGVQSSLRVVSGGGHGQGFPLELREEVRAFFDRHLASP